MKQRARLFANGWSGVPVLSLGQRDFGDANAPHPSDGQRTCNLILGSQYERRDEGRSVETTCRSLEAPPMIPQSGVKRATRQQAESKEQRQRW